MKRTIISAIFGLLAMSTFAQKDSTTFKAYLSNDEYEVYMNIDFYHNNLQVPHQEIFGEVPGYFGDVHDGRKWLITDAKIKGKKAKISLVNDYGSEDLVAELTYKGNGEYLLEQKEGSDIKIARNRKWKKLPVKMTFINKKFKPEGKD